MKLEGFRGEATVDRRRSAAWLGGEAIVGDWRAADRNKGDD
jgi:hypothetical protein